MHVLSPRMSVMLSLLVGLAGGCSRTGVLSEDANSAPDEASESLAAPDLPVAAVEDAAPEVLEPDAQSSVCEPAEEVCDGVDNDCDGVIDDVPPVPCPGGGERSCVLGRLSECPDRCEVCIPGSRRVCFVNYCLYWGRQRCAADGRGFGPCREDTPPNACEDVAIQNQNSPALEQCCIDQGLCCLDEHDLDGDGDFTESLGECAQTTCE